MVHSALRREQYRAADDPYARSPMRAGSWVGRLRTRALSSAAQAGRAATTTTRSTSARRG